MMQKEENKLNAIKEFSHARVAIIGEKPEIIVVEGTSEYIPMRVFKTVFNFVHSLASNRKVSKVIFDKRSLTVFHQPSMEWYFNNWKTRMQARGCSVHRKILPEDPVFVECVTLAREKLIAENPDKVWQQLDIAYSNNLIDAIEN